MRLCTVCRGPAVRGEGHAPSLCDLLGAVTRAGLPSAGLRSWASAGVVSSPFWGVP
jgi:hypothetical protein